MSRAGQIFILTTALCAFGPFHQIAGQRKPSRPVKRQVIVAGAFEAPASAAPLAPDVQRRVDTFEKVWLTIRDGYFDPTFNRLDWNQVRNEFAPKVRAVKSDPELHTLLGEMIKRLERSHLAIISPEVYTAIEKARKDAKERERMRRSPAVESGDASSDDDSELPLNVDDPLTQYGTGIHLSLIGNQFVISRLDKDSAAEYAGIKTGFVIDSVNDVSLPMLLAKVDILSASSKSIRRYLPVEVVRYFLNGERESSVKIGYFDEKDTRKEVTLPRERLKSETVSIGPNFPDIQLTFETVSLNPDVGLVRFNQFAVGVVEKFCNALTEFKDKKALVIDLRGNLGGSMTAIIGLAGMLSDKDMDLGTAIYRSGPEHLEAQSKVKHFNGRVAVLVDGMTASAAEMLSSALQDSGRAIVVGDKSAGETLPAVTVNLPTGARLLYPIANYKSASGKYLESNGIIPDYVAALDRKSLLDGRDAQIDTAVRVLNDNKVFGSDGKALPKAASLQSAITPPDYRGPANFSVAGPPPPPPPIRKGKPPRVLANVTVNAPPEPTEPAGKPDSRDPRAIKILDEFTTSMGSAEAFARIRTYAMTGKLDIALKGTRQLFDYKIYRELPNKYAEISSSPATGEIWSANDGKVMHVKTDFGLDKKIPVPESAAAEIEYLAPLARIRDVSGYPKLSYLGVFDRGGRKVHVVQGEEKTGAPVALSFDVESKMLVSVATDYSTVSYSDFRKVGDVMLPFRVDRGSAMTITFDDIKLNTAIDASVFRPREHCFDTP
ncbi:MAG TPA: S41 family peptidase [Pyrinomonadaceae bacterium]|nr:S41 family peptidase [Pyrinomonadaceae bacterium]